MTPDEARYYASHSIESDPAELHGCLDALPRDPRALVAAVAGLILDPAFVGPLGVVCPPDSDRDIESRRIAEMLTRILARDPGTLAAERPPEKRLIISDAGARSDWVTDEDFASPLTRNVRATDLLMSRVSDLDDETLQHGVWSETVIVSLHDRLSRVDDPEALPPETQMTIRYRSAAGAGWQELASMENIVH